jgi:hypothetical protein
MEKKIVVKYEEVGINEKKNTLYFHALKDIKNRRNKINSINKN